MNIIDRLRGLRDDNTEAGERMDAMRPRFDRLADRHTNGAAPRAVSAFNLFQTPAEVAAQLVCLLNPTPNARILEPSAGLGRILDALALWHPSEVVAVEVAPECARELFIAERPKVTIRQRDFLACTPADLGEFDFVAMNPPFHMRADVAHIRHALQFLRPGGRLAALCMTGPARRAAFPDSQWIDLPSRSFRKEGTGIDVSMIIMTKP